ncbi:hypothetical protein R1sor_009333 [Riccia sorocarpa]|uniref:Patatin n=1 Tax=Riccia sorocarpa TaxID=122646 RepID=A0ABD3HXJ3_9MARC
MIDLVGNAQVSSAQSVLRTRRLFRLITSGTQSRFICQQNILKPGYIAQMGVVIASGVTSVNAISGGGAAAKDHGLETVGTTCSISKPSKLIMYARRVQVVSPRSQLVLSAKMSTKGAEDFPSSLLDKFKTRFGFKQSTGVSVKKEDLEDEIRKENAISKEIENEVRSGSLTVDTAEDDEEIVSVTRDEINPGLIWERREKDVKAEERRPQLTSPGFSFSAAGLLFPYHLGVCECLMEHGYLTENTPLAGSSAGALVCAVVASGLKMSDALLATKALAKDCRENGTAFRLGAVLRVYLESSLPDDAHVRTSGRIRVAITQVFRQPRGLLVDQFDSKEDLINALHTSCFIPGYLAPRPVTVFRNRICVDGGITLFMPPTAAEKTVKVCAFSAAAWGIKGIEISPDHNPKMFKVSNRQLLNWALEPAEDEILDGLYEMGYEDALVWVRRERQGLGASSIES